VPKDSRSSVITEDVILLVPEPSADPHDTLNWPLWRKASTGFTLLFSLFVGFASGLSGQVQISQQAALYHKTPVQITYFVCRTIFPGCPEQI
jgi:hypothetical protein